MILLDTNVIYYLCELSQFHIPSKELLKRIKEVDKSEKLYISSVSLNEIIARYHKHANQLRRIVSYLRNNNIDVVDNDYFKKIVPYQYTIAKMKQNEVDRLWLEIKENKVDVEARYTTIMFSLIFSSCILFETAPDIDAVTEEYKYTFHNILSITRDAVLYAMKDLFNSAYDTDDCENYVRTAFYNLLETFLPAAISVCKEATTLQFDENGMLLFSQNEKIYQDELNNLAKSIQKSRTPMYFIMKRAAQYSKIRSGKEMSEFINNIHAIITNMIKEETIKEYFISIVEKCLFSGGAFMKNDINDALILSTVNSNDIFLSFDNGVIKHMEKHQSTRNEYAKSLNAINQILNS